MEDIAPAQLEATTREGYPTLWGQGEIAAYASIVADQLGQPRPRRGRTWTWDRLPGFPAPVARLLMGNVYLADEMRPWVRNHIGQGRPHNTARTPDVVRKAILAERGTGSLVYVGGRYGVSATTVARIWATGE